MSELSIVMLGAPGAGKGTQAVRIAETHGIPHISTGEMLRAAIAAGSELGQKVKGIVESGALVPDELIVEVIRERLAQPDAKNGFVLDGFPRTIVQAEALDALLAELGRPLQIVLELELSEETAVERMLGRAAEQGRADDTPEVIKNRFAVYRRETEPLSSYYRSTEILVAVDSSPGMDEVFAEIERVLDDVA
ncbi:MAG TPA: adenylate kinase [Gaiellaceae bacterium]|jgi:adenylate kinase